MKILYCIFFQLFFTTVCFSNTVIDKTPVRLFTEGNGYILVQAKVNNHIGLFLVDTGFQTSSITSQFASKIGYVGDEKVTTNFHGIPAYDVPKGKVTLTVGKSIFKKVDILVLSGKALKFEYDGILGFDVLSKAIFSIDYKSKELIFHKKISDDQYRSSFKRANLPYSQLKIGDCTFNVLIDTGQNKTSFSRRDWNEVLICSDSLEKVEEGTLAESSVSATTSYSSQRVPIVVNLVNAKKFEIYVYQGADRSNLGLDYLNNFQINYLGNNKFLLKLTEDNRIFNE